MPALDGFVKSLGLVLLRADRWPWAVATIYTYQWEYHPGSEAPEWSHDLTYSYRVGEDVFSGSCRWADNDGDYSFHKGDTIDVRYDLRHPERSYFPEKQGTRSAKYIACALLLIIVIALLTITKLART